MRIRWRSVAVLLAATLASLAATAAPAVSVAAAANLTYVIASLNAEFARSAPGVHVSTTLGASGSLFAQITHGAPFDVFLSADTLYPAELARAGGDPATLRTFAIGRLALWSARKDLPVTSVTDVVRNGSVRKLAIALPSTAPYGRAAQAALEKLGLWSEAQRKLVIGESIAQAAQFVETGNADAGFVALSLLKSPRLADVGHWIEVPPENYDGVSLAHACILTRRGAANEAARRYLAFLASPAAQRILEANGYRMPKHE